MFSLTFIAKLFQVHQTREDLLAKVERQKILIQQLSKEKKTLYQKMKRCEVKMDQLRETHETQLAKLRDESFQASRMTNNPRGWLSPSGNVAISIRRNIGNTACALLGHVILEDISASSVARAEIRSGASLVAHSRTFYELCRQVFRYGPGNADDQKVQQLRFAIHSFRQDATNSGVWRRSKLAAMELETFFTDGVSEFRLRRLADVQKVSDGSAQGTVAMTKKRMESLGCPTWAELRNCKYLYKLGGMCFCKPPIVEAMSWQQEIPTTFCMIVLPVPSTWGSTATSMPLICASWLDLPKLKHCLT